ncbi:MAG: nucleoside kinase [Clostridiales bacterium]|nr:nucleoside kinase [Clostridiales bacterium]
MIIELLDQKQAFDAPCTVKEIIARMAPQALAAALGCFRGGQALELTEVIREDCRLHPITFQNEEGRRMYERSLRFVLLMAVKRLYPHLHLRIEHSIGYGVYMRFLEQDADQQTVDALQAEMEKITAADLPFTREKWSREQAIAYFQAAGREDKMRLLAYRPYDYFPVYRCGGLTEYFYGIMLPSTGYVSHFRLLLHDPGMVLQMPSPQDPSLPAPFISRPNILATFRQSNRWCDILGCMNAADVNDMTVGGRLNDFIRVNEALHDKSIGDIADGIAARGARAIFVAGPSSSGKTTFSNRLCIHLRVLGLHPVLISLDDFYLDRDLLPLEADGKPDLEALSALDVPLLRKCLSDLLSGKETIMPRFDFTVSKRAKEGYPLRLAPDQPLILEGIHGLNPALHDGFDPALIATIYISQLTCLNLDHHNRIRTTDARLLRRIVRDHHFRNTPPEETLDMWNSVRRGEEKWIFPYQEQADFVFNSALHYELPVLKIYAYELLKNIPPDSPHYLSSRRLLKILHYILPATDESLREIPPLSLLREFIGGCTLYK